MSDTEKQPHSQSGNQELPVRSSTILPINLLQKSLVAIQDYLTDPTPQKEAIADRYIELLKEYERRSGVSRGTVFQPRRRYSLMALAAILIIIIVPVAFLTYFTTKPTVDPLQTQIVTLTSSLSVAQNASPESSRLTPSPTSTSLPGPVEIRLNPNNADNNPILTTLERLDRENFTGVCSQDGRWAQVTVPDGTDGWVSIGGLDESVLGPICGLTITAAATVTPTPEAPQAVEPTPTIAEAMVYIEGGQFQMGSDRRTDELPIHAQEVQSFWIDPTEVTNGAYLACVAAGGCEPAPWNPEDNGGADDRTPIDDPRYANFPVDNVSWFQAGAYCSWRGSRLPTELEWEFAARGEESRIYPWGNEWIPANAWSGFDQRGISQPVGSKPAGATPSGIMDLSGNVWEWTSTIMMLYPYNADDGRENPDDSETVRVVRGGSFVNGEEWLYSARRVGYKPSLRIDEIGFRCVRDFDVAVAPTAIPAAGAQAALPACTEADIARAQAGVATNGEWTPCSQVFDGVEMVLVPGGCFQMGLDPQAKYFPQGAGTQLLGVPDGDRQCFNQPFWIDKSEMTQANYVRFGGYFPSEQQPSPTMPTEQVNWTDAQTVCEARGGRLPTEREWEYAVRGPENLYAPQAWNGQPQRETQPILSRPDDVTWVGGYDFVSNLTEWIFSRYLDYGDGGYNTEQADVETGSMERSQRGGSWTYYFQFPEFKRAASRLWNFADRRDPGVGFRCVRDFN